MSLRLYLFAGHMLIAGALLAATLAFLLTAHWTYGAVAAGLVAFMLWLVSADAFAVNEVLARQEKARV